MVVAYHLGGRLGMDVVVGGREDFWHSRVWENQNPESPDKGAMHGAATPVQNSHTTMGTHRRRGLPREVLPTEHKLSRMHR